ncbi:hypothetical protein TNCV_3483041 [Trichonephila clavipes]|nr:hypothetical protein TNCV_3483041 [Trichonephila clavipes]
MITAEQRIRNAFQVDTRRITKCFRDYIDSCVKMVHLPPVLMEGVVRCVCDSTAKYPGRNPLGPCGQNTRHKYNGCIMSSLYQSTNRLECFAVAMLVWIQFLKLF